MTVSTSPDERRRVARRRGRVVIAGALCALAASATPSAASGGGSHGHKRCHGITAAPVTMGANWTLTTPTGTPATVAGTVDQVAVAKFEINGTCGLRVGTSKHSKKPIGARLAVVVRDNATTAATSAALTHELINQGAVAVVGGGGSISGPPAAQAAVERGIPFGANQSAADAISGCTAAERANSAVTKSPTPVYGPGTCWNHRGYAFRTTATGRQWGMVTAEYARSTYPDLETAAVAYLDNDFGRPNRDGLVARFEALGGDVLATGGFSGGAAPTVADLKTLLRTITSGNPELIIGSNTIALLTPFMQAYIELRDDPTWLTKPANFDTLKFVWGSTLSGDYSGLSPASLAVLVNQSVLVQPSWNPDSQAFQRWFALYRAYNPGALPPSSGFTMSGYDALMVMSLAISAAGTTSAPRIAAKLRQVSNPPGKVVCPGQWRKAFRLLSKGEDVNYEGALGSVDLDERGNATGITYGAFNVQPNGATTLSSTFGSAAPTVCKGRGVGTLRGHR